jgi:hypothetical protein
MRCVLVARFPFSFSLVNLVDDVLRGWAMMREISSTLRQRLYGEAQIQIGIVEGGACDGEVVC